MIQRLLLGLFFLVSIGHKLLVTIIKETDMTEEDNSNIIEG